MNLFSRLPMARQPKDAARLIGSEVILLDIPWCWASLTLRNFVAPHRRCSWKRSWFMGSLAITDRRLVAHRMGKRMINIPIADDRFDQLHIAELSPSVCSLTHAADLFQPMWRGEMEYRFRIRDSREVTFTLERLRRANRTTA